MPPFRQGRRTRSSPRAGTMSAFALGPTQVRRSGYGVMQLIGPYAFGTLPDQASAIGVLQAGSRRSRSHRHGLGIPGPSVSLREVRSTLLFMQVSHVAWRSEAEPHWYYAPGVVNGRA
jgi:hypothetical protein